MKVLYLGKSLSEKIFDLPSLSTYMASDNENLPQKASGLEAAECELRPAMLERVVALRGHRSVDLDCECLWPICSDQPLLTDL